MCSVPPKRAFMKKVFPLVSERHKPARVAEQIRSEVRKYLKRERSKKLDEELYDYWDFHCRAGKSAKEAMPCHEKEIGKALDEAVAGEWPAIYLEILAKPVKRGGK
jgi:hypothetical protein